MPQFEQPSIHKVSSISAEIIECHEGKSGHFACLLLTFTGRDDDERGIGKLDIYFNGIDVERARAYAVAINGAGA